MTSASEAAVEHQRFQSRAATIGRREAAVRQQRFQSRAATIGKTRVCRAIADGGA
jgi:hypothetical protein